MDTNQIKRVLNTLDEDEETIKILYYFIQRLTESQIATRVGLSEGTVRSRLHNISAKMSAGYVLNDETPGAPLDPKYRFITGEVETVVLDALGRDTPDWGKFPFDISVPDLQPRPIETRPTPNEGNRLNTVIWGVLAVFFLFGGWRLTQLVVWDCNPFTSSIICPFDQSATVADGEQELASENQDPLLSPTIDVAAEETRIQALVNEGLTSQAPTPVTPDPTGTEQAIQTEAAQRVEQILTETAAAIPSDTPTNTATPTITPTPTSSNTPTPTVTPTATPLFEDNFNSGLNPAWQVISGEPILVNGRLTANTVTWLAVGDSSWTNYIVQFRRVSDQISGGCGSGNVIAFRVQDIDNYISYFWHFCTSGFQIAEGGKVTNLPGGTGNTRNWHDFKFTVNGGEYTARLDNVTRTYFNTVYTEGGLLLRLKPNTVIDDFIVWPINEGETP